MLTIECKQCDGNGDNLIQTGSKKEWVECKNCHGSGRLEDDLEKMVYVNIYAVTREFGGYEEGGWYYDHLECIESVPVRNKNSDVMKEEMEKEYEHIKDGDISSVLGGTALAVYIESKPKESETTEIPQYE